jgi:phosphoribosylformimino-5-aminoimidazole carboxamide ribotide isomerase
MRVIPVIDLMGGQVVRGVAGRRESYRPMVSQIAADARPATVARALVERFGFDTAYVADLDAIMHGQPDVNAWTQIAGAGLKLWIDAGVGNSNAAWRFVNDVAKADIDFRLVVGLETLESEADLFAIGEMFNDAPPIFSLDMKEGRLLSRNPAWSGLSPLEIVLLAESVGVRDVIVLDLADVGTSGGTRTLELCRQIRNTTQMQRLIAGGGVRGLADLRVIAEAGCEAVLVASALHDGRLTRDDVEAAKTF